MTLNFGECPNVENVSTLSMILEMDVPDKYFLSAKACWGIIRRAEQRNKEIPVILKIALHQFEGDLKDGKYNLGDNTLLASHLLNVAVEINMNDSRMKPVKIEKRMRIDGAVSVFDAMTMVSKYHSEIGKKLLNEAA